jgi:hypothetical protein
MAELLDGEGAFIRLDSLILGDSGMNKQWDSQPTVREI